MSFDSLSPQVLRERGSQKWTRYPDTIGAFVAESDFGTAPAVRQALSALSERDLFGYIPEWMERELREAAADWYARRFDCPVRPEHVVPIPDVLVGLVAALDFFTPPGSPVVLPTPAYMPFLQVPHFAGREVIEVPMHEGDEGWSLDLDGIDAAFARGAGLLIVCQPHNPIGKVYTAGELRAVAEIVERHGARVFSDEIHAPLTYAPAAHVPYAAVSEAAAGHALTATSASKAFNIPGLKCAQFLFSNPADKERWDEVGAFTSHGASNPGIVANTAAYRDGTGWLDGEILPYLDGNRRALTPLIAEHLPGARYREPDGTYLAWIDLRDVPGVPDSDLDTFFRERAGVALTCGRDCGEAGAGQVRLNFALPRPILIEAIERMGRALRG